MALHLFEGYGVELEYMIVDATTLKVKPIADQLLKTATGRFSGDFSNGAIGWSNELVLHVIELKTNGPVSSLTGISKDFQKNIVQINGFLKPHNAVLMPTAMHPFMNPYLETALWPHSNHKIYKKYDDIFDCHQHGWSNLQSIHLNLPFFNDEEFGRLHAAIRLILPLLPALAASSPIVDGKVTGWQDTRLKVYQNNQRRIPQIAGEIIPEAVFSQSAYEKLILKPIYKAIAPYDPEGVLQDEWLNSRGAIARFHRNTIEIRLLDIQECPTADIAILKTITAVIQNLCNEQYSSFNQQRQIDTAPLADILQICIKSGENGLISNKHYLQTLGLSPTPINAGMIWKHLAQQVTTLSPEEENKLSTILEQGTLATRIRRSLKQDTNQSTIRQNYHRLVQCLKNNQSFAP